MKSNSEPSLVSIITVVWNNVNQIEDTIKSVLHHQKIGVEYIIVDGGSTDGTVDVIKQYESQIHYWVSEKDQGIYDAINKGMAKAKGHFLYVLNCGDRLLYLPYKELNEAKQSDVVMFNVQLSNGKIFSSGISPSIKLRNTIHHQGVFYNSTLNIRYDLSFRIFSDFDLNQRLYKEGRRFTKYELVVGSHSLEGISHNKKHFREILAVVRKNYGTSFMICSWLYFRFTGMMARLNLNK